MQRLSNASVYYNVEDAAVMAMAMQLSCYKILFIAIVLTIQIGYTESIVKVLGELPGTNTSPFKMARVLVKYTVR